MNKDVTDWRAGSRQLGICEGESGTGPLNYLDMTTCIHSIIALSIFTIHAYLKPVMMTV